MDKILHLGSVIHFLILSLLPHTKYFSHLKFIPAKLWKEKNLNERSFPQKIRASHKIEIAPTLIKLLV